MNKANKIIQYIYSRRQLPATNDITSYMDVYIFEKHSYPYKFISVVNKNKKPWDRLLGSFEDIHYLKQKHTLNVFCQRFVLREYSSEDRLSSIILDQTCSKGCYVFINLLVKFSGEHRVFRGILFIIVKILDTPKYWRKE